MSTVEAVPALEIAPLPAEPGAPSATAGADPYPQLSFEIDNPGARNTVYITTDPAVNKLTLRVGTNTAGTVFTPGTLVPPGSASSSTGSLLYLDFTALGLSDDELRALVLTADSWTFQAYPGTKQVVGMTPTTDVTLGPNDSVTVSIAKLVLTHPPAGGSAQLRATTYRVSPITAGNLGLPTSFKVLVVNAPDGKADLHPQVALSVPQANVVSSVAPYDPVKNALTLVFSPGTVGNTVPAGPKTEFNLTFVYAPEAPGFGALTTPQRARDIQVTAGQNAGAWKVTPGADQENPSWLLQPPDGKPIVGSGSASTVEFNLDGIVTDFAPGATLLLVSYTGVPGYQDGSYTLVLRKLPHVEIRAFSVAPDPTVLSGGAARVTLAWTVANAGTLTLMPGYQDVTGKRSFETSITDTATFTLVAQGTQMASAGNQAVANVVATVLPVINSFTASPAASYYKDLPRSVDLAWNVNTTRKVQIVSSVGGTDPNTYSPVGTLSRTVAQPQLLTLIPEGEQDSRVRRSVLLSAFQPIASAAPAPGAPGGVGASPGAGFAVATLPGSDKLYVFDTLGFLAMGSPVATGKKPLGVAFSADGSQIYAACSGDGTVSVIGVTPTGSTPPYAFTAGTPLTAGGSPQAVTPSPDGRFLYVTVDNGSAAGSLVVFQKGSSGFTQLTTIATGAQPRGVAVAPSGAQVFVANQGDATVTVVGVDSTGTHQKVNTFTGLPAKPGSLAVTPDGAALLVACAGTGPGTVLAIDTQFPTRRNGVQVGNGPAGLAVMPGGAYAFVANATDGTVSLLAYDSSSHTLKVLGSPVQAGASPGPVAVSPEGGLVFVGNAGGAGGLTVLTLAQYQQQAVVAIGAQPTNVSVSADAAKVFVYHNALITARGGTPSDGFFVYETAPQTVTQQMKGKAVVSCLASPAAARAYVTIVKEGAVNVVDTATYQTVKQLTPPARPGGGARLPLSLAVSANGRRLFALVDNGSLEYSLAVWDADPATDGYTLAADLVLFTAGSRPAGLSLACTPDGAQAFAAHSVAPTLWAARETEHGGYEVRGSVTVGDAPSALAVLPDGSRAYVLNRGGLTNSISVVETATLGVQTVYLPEPVYQSALNDLAASPDGSRIFASDSLSSGIRVLDPRTLRIVQTISWTSGVQGPYGIAVLPDGSRIFTANITSGNLGIIQQVQPA